MSFLFMISSNNFGSNSVNSQFKFLLNLDLRNLTYKWGIHLQSLKQLLHNLESYHRLIGVPDLKIIVSHQIQI